MTSVKPAARWKERAKERIEFTPPTSPRAEMRFETEDLEVRAGARLSWVFLLDGIGRGRVLFFFLFLTHVPPASDFQVPFRTLGARTLSKLFIILESDTSARGFPPLICVPYRGVPVPVGHEETGSGFANAVCLGIAWARNDDLGPVLQQRKDSMLRSEEIPNNCTSSRLFTLARSTISRRHCGSKVLSTMTRENQGTIIARMEFVDIISKSLVSCSHTIYLIVRNGAAVQRCRRRMLQRRVG